MPHDDLSSRVLKLLAEERASHGHGSAADIDHRLGKCEGYLSRVFRGEIGLQLDTLFKTLAALDVDPVDFFTRAVGTSLRPEPLLRRLEREGSCQNAELFARLERLVKEEAMPQPTASPPSDLAMLQARLEDLDVQRFSEAEAPVLPAEELVETALGLVESSRVPQRIELLCRALGVLASCYRVTARFTEAARCLRIALSITYTDPLNLATTQANLLQRACYVLGDQGEYRIAIELARQACDMYVLHHDLESVGKTLVDRAIMLNRADQSDAAFQFYRSSLKYLPERAWSNRFSAYNGLGWISLRLGKVGEASQFAQKARAIHQTKRGLNWWRLVWLQGEVSLQCKDLLEAEQLLRAACAGLRELSSWSDVALVSIRLSKSLLLAGKVAEMRQTAAEMLQLLKPLHKYQVTAAAIQEFTRAALAGEVTAESLDRIAEEIQKGASSEWGTHNLG